MKQKGVTHQIVGKEHKGYYCSLLLGYMLFLGPSQWWRPQLEISSCLSQIWSMLNNKNPVNTLVKQISHVNPKSSNTYSSWLVVLIKKKDTSRSVTPKVKGLVYLKCPWQLNRKWRGSQSVCPPFLSVLQQAGLSPRITDRILTEKTQQRLRVCASTIYK